MRNIREIDIPELARLLEEDPSRVRLIDIRTPAEVAQGMIPGGRHVPLHLAHLEAGEWRDESRTTVIYCRSGVRSAKLCAWLAEQGLDGTVNLRQGILGWAGAGLPVETPPRERIVA